MARVTITRPAKEHLREIHRYIARDSHDAAARIARRIRTEVRRLAQYPE